MTTLEPGAFVEAVIALLGQMSRDGGFVFPGRSKTIFVTMSLAAVLWRTGHDDIMVHGFGSAFRDWCAWEVGNAFAREVCEHALAHSLPSKVDDAGQRGDQFVKRVPMIHAWADHCTKKADASVEVVRR